MNKCVLLSLVASLRCHWHSPSRKAAQTDEQVLRRISEGWAQALVKADTKFTDRITTPDWHLVAPDGSVATREDVNADMKTGALKFESFRLDGLKIHVYGDAAVVIGTETEKTSFKVEDVSGQYRYTDVFIERDGR